MNIVTLIGNVTNDIELRKTKNGSSVCEFVLATNEYTKDGNVAEFHTIQAWGKDAENIAKYMKKGSKLAINGRLHHIVYEKPDGTKVKKSVVIVNKSEFISTSSVSTKESMEPVHTYEFEEKHTPSVSTISFEADELPFY